MNALELKELCKGITNHFWASVEETIPKIKHDDYDNKRFYFFFFGKCFAS